MKQNFWILTKRKMGTFPEKLINLCDWVKQKRLQPKRFPSEHDTISFPTLENCQNPNKLPSLKRKVFDNIYELQTRGLQDRKTTNATTN